METLPNTGNNNAGQGIDVKFYPSNFKIKKPKKKIKTLKK